MHLDRMLFVCFVLLPMGLLAARCRHLHEEGATYAILAAGLALIAYALGDGMYWNIFGRGHGFFTANRTTALIIFLICLAAPQVIPDKSTRSR